MTNTIFNQEYVVAMHTLVEELTVIGKFTEEEKRKLFCWLLDYHEELSQKEAMLHNYPEGMPFSFYQEVILENQIDILQRALTRDLTQERITAKITIEFDIDAEKLKEKSISAKWLLDYIKAVDDDTVDGFNINPVIPWCDVTSDFFISNPRIVDRKFVKNEV